MWCQIVFGSGDTHTLDNINIYWIKREHSLLFSITFLVKCSCNTYSVTNMPMGIIKEFTEQMGEYNLQFSTIKF